MALGAIVLAVLRVLQCSGPRPTVSQVSLRPPAQPGLPYEVEAEIHNQWRGHGEVKLTARLRERATDRQYEADHTASLEPNETLRVVIPVSAQPGDYEPQVEVEYPPR
jgi:hypothetical protein